MGMFNAIDISASGMTAERLRMDVISNNLANADSTRTPNNGGPYRRKYVIFEPRSDSKQPDFFSVFSDAMQQNPGNGVRAVRIAEDKSPFKLKYDPGNPDADKQGYVHMPNVNVVSEMTDMITASRAYEADVTSVDAAKNMFMKALNIGK